MSVGQLGLMYAGATFVFLFSGMPIAFAVGAVALIFMYFFMPPAQLSIVAETIFSELNSFTLLTIPLFIMMGAAIGKSRAGADLYNSLNRWLYKVPGGLGLANTLACSVFAAMCGSSPATCSAIGSSGIPEMRKRGYSDALATGLIAAGGTLGILIPPSLTLILYGLATEQSIGKLFMAGVGPGLLLTMLFAVWVMYKSTREKRAARADVQSAGTNALLAFENYSWKDRLETLPRLTPFLGLIVIVMVALYGGWATPSEVAGIGAFGALVMVMAIYGCWRWGDLRVILSGTARESSMIMLIIAMSFLYTYVMSYLHITQIGRWLADLPGDGQVGVLLLGEHPAHRSRFLPAAGGHHPHGDAHSPAGFEGVGYRPDLVRRDHDHPHGDGAHPPPGRTQPVCHQRHRTRRQAEGHYLGRRALPAAHGAGYRAPLHLPGDRHLVALAISRRLSKG